MAISGDRNVIKKEAKKILKYKDLTTDTAHVECKKKSDTSNKWGYWNHLKILHKISEQHTTYREAQNQGTKETAILCTVHILREVLL